MNGTPVTEAGRALLRSDFDTTGWGPTVVREHVARAVLAIEAEATALEHARAVAGCADFVIKEREKVRKELTRLTERLDDRGNRYERR